MRASRTAPVVVVVVRGVAAANVMPTNTCIRRELPANDLVHLKLDPNNEWFKTRYSRQDKKSRGLWLPWRLVLVN